MGSIKFNIKPCLRKRDRLIYNLHIVAIAIIILFLSIFYYEVYIFHSRIFPFFWYLQAAEFSYNIIGILFCIPMIYAALIFWWRGALITWILSTAIMLPQILTFKMDIVSHVTNIFYLLIPLIIVIYVCMEHSWRDKGRKSLAERESERQNYISQIFKAQEDERKRISQEIHDDSIQRLAGVASIAQMLSHDKHLESYPIIKERAESIKDTIISISQDLRRLSIDLRPTILDDLGLIPALCWLVENFKQESGINAQIEITGDNRQTIKKITVLFFRIVQEALNNAKRHSEATNVVVKLQFTDKNIVISVQDNGKGFSVPKIFNYYELIDKGKLGLIGMQQRTDALNGTFNIQSEIGKGTIVLAMVDLQYNNDSPLPGQGNITSG